MIENILNDADKKFAATQDHLKQSYATLRSTNVSPALVEDLEVKAYEDTYQLKELAAISLPEPNSLLIQPWDQNVIKPIEKALQQATLGAQPQVDGNDIRLTIPPLSEEQRETVARKAKEMAEDAKISVRNIRQEKMKSLDEMIDNGKVSEDDGERAKKSLQESVDTANQSIESLREKKIKELETM